MYFDIKIDYIDITKEDFQKKITSSNTVLGTLFEESKKLDLTIINRIDKLDYGNKN